MFSAVTRNIAVSVEPFYLEGQSDPADSRYVWAYRVTIDNRSEAWIKLLSRYWHITDGAGRVEEVRGDGVVGEQPELNPGDSYQYTSGCPLSTPSGFMAGSYTMRDAAGDLFDVDHPGLSARPAGQGAHAELMIAGGRRLFETSFFGAFAS